MSAASTMLLGLADMALFANRQTGNQADSVEKENSPEEELPPLSSLFKGALGRMPESGAGDPSTGHSLHVKTIEESSSTLGFNNNQVMKRKKIYLTRSYTQKRDVIS
ncbi:hypothetical protein F5884DRAFT_862663 [Xylogone sp. PMI_703]|nr:hypothetical protein F5884DRAFT_862663 [Xylogone sp. PMI_703]